MIAELGIALTAFKAIKSAIEDGKELMDAGKAVDSFFNAKSNIQKAVNATQKSKGGYKDHALWDEFCAQEEIRKKEKELYEIMICSGRPNLHVDWLKWQSDAKKRREEAEKQLAKEAYNRRKMLNEIFQTFFITLCGLCFVGGVLFFVATY